MTTQYDAIVIGSGPNGLAAAIAVAQAGRSVLMYEAKDSIGGGSRSLELTFPGFIHDVCSAIHPLAVGSPFLQTLPLKQYGLEWISPPLALAHPFDDGTAAALDRSIEVTGKTLACDMEAYRRLMKPFVAGWDKLASDILAPLRPPHYPFTLARFGLKAMLSARMLAESTFKGERARAFFAGLAGHSMMPLDQPITAGFGLVLGILGHVVGWPFPRGGAQKIVDAMAAYLRSLGGQIITGMEVQSLEDLPSATTYFCDVTPRQLLRIAEKRLSKSYQHRLERYRYGPGIFKIDFALDGPIPWKAEACTQAGTVHIGGTFEEIAASERAVWKGQHAERPYVLLAQPSLFDDARAPAGKQTAWAYCHVPNGSTFDMTERIEAQIERFAPGFRECILARSTKNTLQMEQYNANYVGGDINGGVQDFRQFFTRPTVQPVPYATGAKGVYICSSSTPPGGGVHGMCGYFAAQVALHDVLK